MSVAQMSEQAGAVVRTQLWPPAATGQDAGLPQLGLRRPPGLFHVLFLGGWVGPTVLLLIIAALVIASTISKRRRRNGR